MKARPMTQLTEILRQQLEAAGTGWSMGSFGAIAEFHQDPGEAATALAPLGRHTTRGGIRFDRLQGLQPVAYEITRKDPARWGHGVALCLPAARAAMNRRAVLTELGPDTGALREEDRAAILFDMGLEQPQVDFCIRTGDPELLAVLRGAEGRSVLDPANPAMGAILKAHPHRVALTAAGRTEVWQKIGGPDTGGVSPPGPHTHVLPQLLRAKRSHSANITLPDGLVPVAFFYPANPLTGPMGEAIPFDRAAHDAFQHLAGLWATPEHRAVKEAVARALEAGEAPGTLAPTDRAERKALRVALRQARQTRGEDALLRAWIAHHDRPGAAETDETGENADETPDRIGH